MLRPDLLYLSKLDNVVIDRPIFIVGLQGGGGTFLSRIFRRVEGVVTLSGNHKYFTGADEMQSALGPFLPQQYSGILHKYPKSNNFGTRRGWSYACDELLPFHKYGEWDYKEDQAAGFRHAIKVCIKLNGKSGQPQRFIDKSQSYALKMPIMRKALEGSSPKFIGIVRNPYVMCWRAASMKTALAAEKQNIEHKLLIATQHWNNTVQCLIENEGQADFRLYTIEGILEQFEEKVYEIAQFAEVDLKDEHFPKASDVLPAGSKRQERWYPVQREINNKYLEKVPAKAKEIIFDQCKEYIERFGY